MSLPSHPERAMLLLLPALWVLPCMPVSAQAVPMRLLHEFADGYGFSIAADADNDGRAEIHGSRFVPPNVTDYDVLERNGLNSWVLTSRVSDITYANEGGDFDRDGRFDILRISLANGIEVWESADSSSFPLQLVYTNPNIGFFQSPAVFADDLDGDGRGEILYTFSGATQLEVVVLENSGDNTYQEVARPQFGSSNDYPGYVVAGDFDGDGRGDILTHDSGGRVYVLESRGDNAYDLVWETGPLSSYGPRRVAVIGDGDGDGLLEFGVVTMVPDRLMIFEAVGDDQYVPVFVQDFPMGITNIRPGDLDGDGRNEVILRASFCVEIWRALANDSWQMIWEAPAAGRSTAEFLAYDFNGNGFGELFYTCCYPDINRSFIVEWPFRVDASQNDPDRPGDALFTARDLGGLRGAKIFFNSQDVTNRIRQLYVSGDPHVTVSQESDETILRLDLPGLGTTSGRRVRFRVTARDHSTGQIVQDHFTYVAP